MNCGHGSSQSRRVALISGVRAGVWRGPRQGGIDPEVGHLRAGICRKHLWLGQWAEGCVGCQGSRLRRVGGDGGEEPGQARAIRASAWGGKSNLHSSGQGRHAVCHASRCRWGMLSP